MPLADCHIGDPAFDEAKLQRYIQWVKETDNARVILVGDIMNTATKSSVSDSYGETMTPQQQLKYAIKLFDPIKHKIIGCTSGNHERRVYKETSIDTSDLLAQALGCYYRPEGLYLKIRLGKGENGKPVTYLVYATHGFGGGKKMGGKANSLQSLSNNLFADVYITGHTHTLMSFQDVYFLPNPRNNLVQEVKRTFCNASSFLNYSGYGEMMGFTASKLGSVRIRLDGKRKDAHISL